MRKFWDWTQNEDTGQRELWLEGVIAEESWWGDEVTPAIFKEELMAGSGPILLHIHSPGGDCIAASQIYTMLMDYPGDVTVQIDALAASCASVIAMAGTHVQMSPTALMMVHNPWMTAMGDAAEMQKAVELLGEVKESIINAYQIKTGLSRTELSNIMDAETWLNAHKAKEMGFCDEVLYENANEPAIQPDFIFSARAATLQLMNKVRASLPQSLLEAVQAQPVEPPESTAVATETALETGNEHNPTRDTEQAPETGGIPEDAPDTPAEEQVSTVPNDRVKADDLMKRLLLLK